MFVKLNGVDGEKMSNTMTKRKRPPDHNIVQFINASWMAFIEDGFDCFRPEAWWLYTILSRPNVGGSACYHLKARQLLLVRIRVLLLSVVSCAWRFLFVCVRACEPSADTVGFLGSRLAMNMPDRSRVVRTKKARIFLR